MSMSQALFTNVAASSQAYRNVRDAKNGPLYSVRHHCEYLWRFFEPYADPDFLTEFPGDSLNARYWEMYLTVTLILSGYEVTCRKPGPDVGIVYRGQRIWFEAVSPTPGDPSSPDFVAPPKMNEVSTVPNEKIVLRYLNSISEKYDRQYANWIKNCTVSKDDAFVIALNPRSIPFELGDSDPPRLLQAAYTLGPKYVTFNRETATAVATGYHFRDYIAKTPKNDAAASHENYESVKVTTGVFQDRKHDALSGLLCSRVDIANHRGEMGSDFQLAPNPHARVPLPETFRLRGTYYGAKLVEDGYEVTVTKV